MAGLCDNNESLQQLQDKISNLQDAFARVMEQEELDTSQRARTSELDDYLQKLSMNPNKTRKNDPHWQHLIALYVLGTGHDPAGLSISSEACAFLKKNAPMKGVGVESAET
ncbi:MAG: hypothetical protein LBH53_02265 [Puniceicoccales bacterium]|jgi:hypothetical protein|nr:hypothetical protein [Puniceicoccales bacterium]